MKINFILLLALFLVFHNTFSQEEYGFDYIANAEKHIKKNKLNRALKELKTAETSNYGFCGNASESAKWQIKYLKSQIYLQQNLYDKSLAEIDAIEGCGFGGNCAKSDSLKVVILIKKFGKEKVANSFKQEKSNIQNGSYGHNVTCIKFPDLNYNFCFTLFKEYLNRKSESGIAKADIPFCDLIKKYNFYKLIE
jgi:hypothetical protein